MLESEELDTRSLEPKRHSNGDVFVIDLSPYLRSPFPSISYEVVRSQYPIQLAIDELSGSSLRFRCSPPLKEGQRLHVAIPLSGAQEKLVVLQGKILRALNELTGHSYILRYQDVRKPVRESIIRYLNKIQREHLRAMRASTQG